MLILLRYRDLQADRLHVCPGDICVPYKNK